MLLMIEMRFWFDSAELTISVGYKLGLVYTRISLFTHVNSFCAQCYCYVALGMGNIDAIKHSERVELGPTCEPKVI